MLNVAHAGCLAEGCKTWVMPRQWDASAYDQVANPQQRWGEVVLDRLTEALPQARLIIDAGCGTGRVTELLLRRYPQANVVALDEAQGMLDIARTRLDRFAQRVEFVCADLGRSLPLTRPADAVMSTATFHWVADHDALFANLAAVTVPGGVLVSQCGGQGNLASVKRVLAEMDDGWLGPAHYANVADTTRRLQAAGYVDVDVWLHDEPTPFPDRDAFASYLHTVILGPQLERLPDDQTRRDQFVERFIDRLGVLSLDYVRLNITAHRGRPER